MSAETLRRAASLMRERAEAASSWGGLPWFAVDGSVHGGTAAPHQVVAPVTIYDGDAEHIASWHPAVALAVADWLDTEAESFDTTELWFHPDDGDAVQEDKGFMFKDALTVARAYLGEAS